MKKVEFNKYSVVRCSGTSHGVFTDEKSKEVKEYSFTHLFCEKVVENEKGIEISRTASVEKLSPDALLTDIIFDAPVDFYYDKFGRVALCHLVNADG